MVEEIQMIHWLTEDFKFILDILHGLYGDDRDELSTSIIIILISLQ